MDLAKLLVRLELEHAKYTADIEKVNNKLDRFARRSKSSFDKVTRAAAGIFSGVMISRGLRAVVEIGDEYTRLNGRLRLVSRSSEEFATAQRELFRVAQRTRTAYTDVAELYTRIAQIGPDLGASQSELLRFSEGIGNALRISGSSSQEARGALLQLSQALASGTVRAEEYNSVNEGAPEILRAVARNIEGVDGSLGKLRAQVLAGKVSSQDFFRAFLADTGHLEKQAASLPMTVGQAFTVLKNEINTAIAGADLNPLVDSIGELGTTVKDPAFQAGFTSFVAGIVKLAELGARAVASVGRIARLAGETAASWAAGSTDPIERMEDKLGRLDQRIAWLRDQLSKPVTQGRESLQRTLDGLIKEREALAKTLDYEKGQATIPPGEAAPAKAPISVDKISLSGGMSEKEWEKLLDKINEDTEKFSTEAFELLDKEFKELSEMQGDFQGGWNERFQTYMDDLARYAERTTDQMSVYADEAARNMQSAFADFLFDPFEGGMRGMLKSFTDTLRRMVAHAAAARIFDALGLGKGGEGGVLGTILGGIFGGKRADGGPISAGSAYLVGERGPELVMARRDATVIPNHALGGAAITINNHIDARGATSDFIRAMPELLRRNNEQVKADLLDGLRRRRYAV